MKYAGDGALKRGGQLIRYLAVALLIVPFLLDGVVAESIAPAAPKTTDQPARFPSLGQQLPALLSGSGRFSSINPPNQVTCHMSSVAGRVISSNLIHVDHFYCDDSGGYGFSGNSMLVNVELADPADAAMMIPGSKVIVLGTVKSAMENHNGYTPYFLFVENARVGMHDTDADPSHATISYMICQPPELDALAKQLGRQLCVQSTIVANLGATGPALETATRMPVKLSPTDSVSGDPDAITCRLDPEHSDAELPAMTCARNNYWAWWKEKWLNPQLYSTPAPP